MDCPQKSLSRSSKVCSACCRKSSLEIRFQELKSMMEKTQAEIVENNKTINQIHDPLHKIPREIASKIFEFVFPEIDGSEGKINDDRTHTYGDCPLVLGGVCGLWRAIAWATPQLWTEIHFMINPSGCSPCLSPVRTNLFKEYVDRSGALSLRIRVFEYEEESFEASDDEAMAFMNVLNDSSTRWHGISLDLPYTLYTLLSVRPSANHTLQFFQLSTSSRGAIPTLDLIYFTTNLRYLNLGRHQISQVKVSLGELRHMELVTGGEAQFLETFRHAPLLETADIAVYPPLFRSPLLNAPLKHNFLKVLSVRLHPLSPDSFDPFFDRLTLPALEEIAIQGTSPIPKVGVQVLRNLINRSECNLKSFYISDLPWSAFELNHFLLSLPHLRKLRISSPTALSPEDVFRIAFGQSCSTSEDDSDVQTLQLTLPDLEDFDLFCIWTPQDDWLDILRIIQDSFSSREPVECPQRPPHMLHVHMTIKIPVGLTQSELESLYFNGDALELVRTLGEQGVSVYVTAITYDGISDFIRASMQHDLCK